MCLKALILLSYMVEFFRKRFGSLHVTVWLGESFVAPVELINSQRESGRFVRIDSQKKKTYFH